MCVSGFRILKTIENYFTNKGARAISVRDVFNKNIVNSLSLFVSKNLNCYKMVNNGQISIIKMSTGAYRYFYRF